MRSRVLSSTLRSSDLGAQTEENQVEGDPCLSAKKDMEELNIIGTDNMCPVVGLVNDNRLLIGLRNYTPDKWKTISVWTIPGGRCDDGETLGVTLKREVAEEVGITDFNITSFLGTVPGAKEGDIVYVFTGNTKQEAKLMEPEKFSEWAWVGIDKVPENFINIEALELINRSLGKSTHIS